MNEQPPIDNAELVIKAPPPNYDNSAALTAIRSSLGAHQAQGGGDNPGLFGLLPQKMQHGTLRNVLGALGDAFLVGSGHDPLYEQRMQRQELGDAMAGFQQNPGTAASRMAATAVPDAAKMAMDMYEQSNQQKIRQQQMQQTADYHQSMTDSRDDASLQRMTPYAGAMVNGVKDKESYGKAWARADAIAKRIGPNYSAADFGLVDPEDWQPAAGPAGVTASQALTNSATNRSIDQRASAANMSHQDRQAATRVSASKGSTNPTNATMISRLMTKQNNSQTLTPAEQTFWDKNTKATGSAGRSLPAGLTVGGKAAPDAAPKYSQTAVGPGGKRVGWDGKQWVPIK